MIALLGSPRIFILDTIILEGYYHDFLRKKSIYRIKEPSKVSQKFFETQIMFYAMLFGHALEHIISEYFPLE